MIYVVVLLMLLLADPVSATRYWVATTGNDSNACAAIDGDADPGTYKLTPQSGAACLTQAGDRLTIKAGTYNGAGAIIFEPTISVANGTAGNPTIIEGEGAAGCAIASTCTTKLKPTGSSSTNLEGASYITFRNFEIDHTNASVVNNACFRVSGTGSNIILDNMHLHHCYGDGILENQLISLLTLRGVHINNAGRLDTNGVSPPHGTYLNGDDTLIEYSSIHDCGPDNGDHNNNAAVQIYNSSAQSDGRADRPIIRYSHFYNCDYGIIVEGNDAQIYRNVINGSLSIGLSLGHDGAMRPKIYNNTISNNAGECIYVGIFTGSADDGQIINNHCVGNGTNTPFLGAGVTGTTQTTNRIGGTVTDCTVSTTDFRQKVGSSCINAGTAISGHTFNGAAPDQGAFETWTCGSAEVGAVAANRVITTCTNNLNPPLLPASSMTGFTVTQNGSPVTVSSCGRTGTNLVDCTLGSSITGGTTVLVSYSPGNVTDSASIGTLGNQPLQAFSNLAVTNNVSGASSTTLTQTRFRFHDLRGTEDAPVVKPYPGAAVSTNLSVAPGARFRLRLKVACTVADCDPVGMILRYSLNGGAYAPIPEVPDAGNIELADVTDPDIPISGTATTEQLSSDHATNVACAIVRNTNAVPTIDLSQNSETECEYAIALDTDVSVGDTYDFRLYNQNGSPLTDYTVTPRVTVVPMTASGGM